MNSNIKIAVCSVISFAAGYVVCKKILEQSYQDITDADHADIKKHYEDRLKTEIEKAIQEYEQWLEESKKVVPFKGSTEKADKLAGILAEEARLSETVAELKTASEESYEKAVEALTNYQIGGAADYMNKPAIPVVIEPRPEPFIIGTEVFMSAEDNYAQHTLTYYVGDDVLANAGDEEVSGDERASAVGDLVQNFGEYSGDPNVVYIRSPYFKSDFEVVKSEGKYSVEVLGLGEESP